MINFVTIHWRSPQWIDLQLDNLERHVAGPYRVFASLNGLVGHRSWDRFHYAEDLEGGHSSKLNALARRAGEESDPSDVLVFLDGDAFPVGPLVPWVEDAVSEHSLVAVRRTENGGDLRPHPCFCATSVGFWREIGGDWRPGPWTSPGGEEFVDAGSALYESLTEREVKWLPITRTNTLDLHPLWFAVYGHRIYHHGAGFRSRFSYADASQVRVDARSARSWTGPPTLGKLTKSSLKDPSMLLRLRPRHAATLGRSAVKSARRYAMGRHAKRAEATSAEVYDRVVSDPGFFRELDGELAT